MEYKHFAYEAGTRKLFPLAAVDGQGRINREETISLVKEALRTFKAHTAHIPAQERASVRHQIEGAAQSLGIAVPDHREKFQRLQKRLAGVLQDMHLLCAMNDAPVEVTTLFSVAVEEENSIASLIASTLAAHSFLED